MTERDAAGHQDAVGRARPGDVGRRITLRRHELGLSRDRVADDAGIAPEYLRYVEEQPAEVAAGSLLRIATALGTTTDELLGGNVDIPPGEGAAAARPVLEELTPPDCWAHLGTHGVGRIALPTPTAVDVLPVNYSVLDHTIVYRTSAARASDAADRGEVSFEVDRLDEALRQGWSVLAVGPAQRVTDPDEASRLARRAASKPWSGGAEPAWVRISPHRLTGRRVLAE